jgi:hypothetical protein
VPTVIIDCLQEFESKPIGLPVIPISQTSATDNQRFSVPLLTRLRELKHIPIVSADTELISAPVHYLAAKRAPSISGQLNPRPATYIPGRSL